MIKPIAHHWFLSKNKIFFGKTRFRLYEFTIFIFSFQFFEFIRCYKLFKFIFNVRGLLLIIPQRLLVISVILCFILFQLILFIWRSQDWISHFLKFKIFTILNLFDVAFKNQTVILVLLFFVKKCDLVPIITLLNFFCNSYSFLLAL